MKEVFFQNACANHAWLWDFTIVGDLENLKCCCFSYSLRSFSRMSSNFHQAFDICDFFICSTFGEKHFCLLWLILFWEKRFPPEHRSFDAHVFCDQMDAVVFQGKLFKNFTVVYFFWRDFIEGSEISSFYFKAFRPQELFLL